jgi:hypothetical protein
MKKILYYILALTVVAGCYKDESSDRYDPIGAIQINGVEEEYNLIMLVDALKITPEVTSTSPDDKVDGFEYLWTYYSHTDYNNASAAGTATPVDTIAQTKDITWDITLKPGDYTIWFRITNPANGYTVYRAITLNVSTEFSNGFYFLKETAGGDTELDFHKPNGAGGWITMPDMLNMRLGAPIAGAPTSLGIFASYPYINKENGQPENGAVLVPMGGKDLKVLSLEDLSLVYDHNDIFFSGEAPDHKPLRAFYLSMFGIPVFIFDDGAYAAGFDSRTGKVGYPEAPAGGCSLSHGMMADDDGSSFPIEFLQFFDELNGQLVYYSYEGTLVSLSGDNNISPTGITHRPLFMGSSGWCVFENPGFADRYLYLLNGDFLMSATTEPILEIRPISASEAPNFNSAELYGAHKTNKQFLYGSTGDKLYMYNTGSDAEKQLTLSGFGAGEQITMITHKPGVHNPANRDDTAGFLFIATHAGGHYKVYMYKVTGGEPDGEPFVIEGTGKVVDMQYAGGSPNYDTNY